MHLWRSGKLNWIRGNTLQCVCLSVDSDAAYQINPILSSPVKAGHSF